MDNIKTIHKIPKVDWDWSISLRLRLLRYFVCDDLQLHDR